MGDVSSLDLSLEPEDAQNLLIAKLDHGEMSPVLILTVPRKNID